MRILYVITQGEQGGAQLYVRTLAQAAKAAGNQVSVAIGENGGDHLRRELEALDIEFVPLKKLKRNISPVNDVWGIFELVGLYQKIKPDIIHLNSTKAGIIGSLASCLYPYKRPATDYKLIYTAHGWVFNEPMSWLKKMSYKALEKSTARQKDRIICVSEYDRWVALGEKIAPARRLAAIHNGIDAEAAAFLSRTEAGKKLFKNAAPPAKDIIIGAIANFYPTKGLDYLIDAANILVNEYKLPVTTVIIGDGKLRDQLEQQIKKSGLENDVILAGNIPNAAECLKALDIAVMPSVKEGFPYFLLEAMAAGLPIVATKVGGMPEIIEDGSTGFLAAARNAKNLADQIKLLAEDEGLRDKFGQAGLARVKKEFSQEKMIRETLALYGKIT